MKQLLSGIGLLTLVVLLGGVAYWWGQTSADSGRGTSESMSGLLKTEGEFRDKLVELKMRRDKVDRGLARLRREKEKTLDELRQQGVETAEDFRASTNPEIKKLAINVQKWNRQIEKIEGQVGIYDEAISSIRIMLDQFERDRINSSVGLTDSQSADLQKIIIDLDERLDMDTTFLEDEALAELIGEELDVPQRDPSPDQRP